MLEPRFFPRADVDLTTSLLSADTRAEGRVVNLSEGGMLVMTRGKLSAGESVQVSIAMAPGAPLTVLGSVVRSTRGNDGFVQLAVTFCGLSDAQANALRALVEPQHEIVWDASKGHVPREIAIRFIPLIRRVARGLASRLPPQVSIDDLVGAGFVALVELYAKNQSAPLADLERIALPRIRWAMMDELRASDPLSRRMRQRARRIGKTGRELEQELGRKPSHAEIAARMGISVETCSAALKLAQSSEATSIDAFEDYDLADQNGVSPEQRVSESETIGQLKTALEALPPRLKRVLELYYGDDLTLRQIGNILGVTEARISQLLSDAVKRMRATCAPDAQPVSKVAPVAKLRTAAPRSKRAPQSVRAAA